MLKVLLTTKVINALHNDSQFFGVTESGDIPDRFYKYPLVNGTEVEGYCIKLYPVLDTPDIESWILDNDAEEVQIETTDDFREQHLPSSVRWFVDLRVEKTSAPPRRKRLLDT